MLDFLSAAHCLLLLGSFEAITVAWWVQ